MSITRDFDALAEAARLVHNKSGEQSLWKAVMSLSAWCFLAQGEGDDAEPMIVSVQGTAMLLAFTDQDRAEAFASVLAAKNGARPGLLEMDRADAVDYCQELEAVGVGTICFNFGEHSFTCSMGKLAELHMAHRE